MTRLDDINGRLGYLRKSWQELYASKPDMKFSKDEADQLKQWNDEMTALGEEQKQLQTIADMNRAMFGAGAQPIVDEKRDGQGEIKEQKDAQPFGMDSLRSRIENNRGYKAFVERKGQGTFTIDLSENEFKTLITLSDAAPQNLRLARIEPYPVERRTVADMMMQGTIDRGTLEYYEETTFTNSAAATAEGGTKPESALDWTLRTDSVSKIATWIPATSESLMDVSWLQSTITNRLVFMVKRVEESELMTGDGTGAHVLGVTQRSGVQTQAAGTDPVPDAILKAANLIRVNAFYEPDGVVIHPLDMQDIRLLRTAEGIYIFGSPSDPLTAMRLWGMEVRETTAQTQNTAVVGAFGSAAQVFRRSGVQVTVSTEHSTYFVENKVAILAEERLGLAVYRPNAFATVTGI